jgi:hypothetical protein
MNRAAWTDSEQLMTDLTLWLDNEPHHGKARLLVRAMAFIAWQRTVIVELKSEIQQLEATARAR